MYTKTSRRRTMVALAAATGGLATALIPSAAQAGPADVENYELGEPITIMSGCGAKKDVNVYDQGFLAATAHWELTCANGNITISGWVDDKRADGKCAHLNAYWPSRANPSHHEYAKDCPSDGPRTEFKWTHPGGSIEGYVGAS